MQWRAYPEHDRPQVSVTFQLRQPMPSILYRMDAHDAMMDEVGGRRSPRWDEDEEPP